MAINLTSSDSSSNVLDNLFQFYVEGVIHMIVGVIGLVGNSFSVLSFARQRIQRVFHRLLLALATFDSIYIVSSVLLYALPTFIEDYTKNVKMILLPYLLPIIHAALLGSIYCTVALAVERYITVCHPFFRFRSFYHSRIFILPVTLFAILYTIPKCFELRLEETLTGHNGTIEVIAYKLVPTEMRKNKMYIRIYLIFINFLVQIFVPFVTLVILNYKTYQTIKDSERRLIDNLRVQYSSNFRLKGDFQDIPETINSFWQRKLSLNESGENHLHFSNFHSSTTSNLEVTGKSSFGRGARALNINQFEHKASVLRKREVALARISIYIAFVFLLCHSVRIVPNLYEMMFTYTKIHPKQHLSFPEWVRQFTQVSHLLITFACSANFYIYYAKYGRRPKFTSKERPERRRRRHSCQPSISLMDCHDLSQQAHSYLRRRTAVRLFMQDNKVASMSKVKITQESVHSSFGKTRSQVLVDRQACGQFKEVIVHNPDSKVTIRSTIKIRHSDENLNNCKKTCAPSSRSFSV